MILWKFMELNVKISNTSICIVLSKSEWCLISPLFWHLLGNYFLVLIKFL